MHLGVYVCDRRISMTVAIAPHLNLDFAPVTDCRATDGYQSKAFLLFFLRIPMPPEKPIIKPMENLNTNILIVQSQFLFICGI